MNPRQRLCIFFTICALIAALLWPPWEFVYRNGTVKVAVSGGYALLCYPPEPPAGDGISLAYGRLFAECLVLILAGEASYLVCAIPLIHERSQPPS